MKMRVAASVALAGLMVLGVSGCQFITPQETRQIKQVSDGMNATVGGVDIRNALLFTTNGNEANLVAAFVNPGSSPAEISMQYTSASGPATRHFTVPANGLLDVRPGGAHTVTLSNIDAKPGSLFTAYFTSGGAGTTVKIPVLTGSLPGYQTLPPTPTPVTVPTAGPTPSPSSSTGSSPSPVGSATPTH